MPSENGWEPAKASPEQCEWVTVPGTDVSLQLLKGWPAAVMRAYAADFNAYVEPLRDADSAAWTPTNAVATSNHLNGTAMDLNWDSHPFRVDSAGFDDAKTATMRDLLAFYEDTMFWAQDWDSPKDAMHHQMGYGTFGNDHVRDFIARKIRPDGFSTFRREGVPIALPSAPVDLAPILSDAMGGRESIDRYRQLLPAVMAALTQCDCRSTERIAMWMAQIGHESAGLHYMEEIADGSAYEGRGDLGNNQPGDGTRYRGRGPIQITGRHNYTQLSAWAHGKGLVPSPTYFVDQPEQLASDRYGFLGVVWYWTVARPNINAMCDANDLEGVTRAINGGLNGLDDRRARWEHARGMGGALLGLVGAAPAPAPPPPGPAPFPPPAPPHLTGGELTPEEQREMLTLLRGFYELRPSKSRYGDPSIPWNVPDLIRNMDGFLYDFWTQQCAEFGDDDARRRVLAAEARGDVVAHGFMESLRRRSHDHDDHDDNHHHGNDPPTPSPTPFPPPAPPAPPPSPFPAPSPLPLPSGGLSSNLAALNTEVSGARTSLRDLMTWMKS